MYLSTATKIQTSIKIRLSYDACRLLYKTSKTIVKTSISVNKAITHNRKNEFHQ